MQGISGSLQLHVAVASSQGQIINQITSGISARKNGPEKDAPGSSKKKEKKKQFSSSWQIHGLLALAVACHNAVIICRLRSIHMYTLPIRRLKL